MYPSSIIFVVMLSLFASQQTKETEETEEEQEMTICTVCHDHEDILERMSFIAQTKRKKKKRWKDVLYI